MKLMGRAAYGGGCHGRDSEEDGDCQRKVVILGSPNVGKSVIFNSLTGARVTVSNYPGTTVAVSKGKVAIDGKEFEIMDTPGMYSLLPITEEERVARSILLKEQPGVVLQVVDGKHLERMLIFTMQLIEAGLPVMLAVNMMDEAEALGIEVDADKLEEELGIPVVSTVAITGQGLGLIRRKLGEYVGN
jgi:ferrous iron transport protein B